VQPGLVAGGLLAGATRANGDLGGVEELGGFGEGDDFEHEAVSYAGDEGVDGIGVVGEEGHGATEGGVDALKGFGAVVIACIIEFAGMAVGGDAALDGGFRGEHGWFLSWRQRR
jgi:hypothetical protein